jgi:hypothetical protein
MTRQSSTATLTTPDLSGYSDDALLTAFAALTHRIHEVEAGARAGRHSLTPGPGLRDQRDALRLEVLRRTDGR